MPKHMPTIQWAISELPLASYSKWGWEWSLWYKISILYSCKLHPFSQDRNFPWSHFKSEDVWNSILHKKKLNCTTLMAKWTEKKTCLHTKMYAKLLELKGKIFNYHSLGTKSAFYKISYSNGTNKWWLKDKMKMQQDYNLFILQDPDRIHT